LWFSTGFGTNPVTWTNAEASADDFATTSLVLSGSGGGGGGANQQATLLLGM
jgi:hypothetical protein